MPPLPPRAASSAPDAWPASATQLPPDARAFLNRMRSLLNLDMDVLERAGVIRQGDARAWAEFQQNPHRWAIGCDGITAARLWGCIEARQDTPPALGRALRGEP